MKVKVTFYDDPAAKTPGLRDEVERAAAGNGCALDASDSHNYSLQCSGPEHAKKVMGDLLELPNIQVQTE